ncbi:MAG: hypothetical protein JO211_04735 [Acidobacteriaceae bacterium]|nr:hypothetical protein [Acidobacteriaceae bacterium]
MKVEPAAFESLKDLKPILGSEGPCLSIFLPTSGASRSQGAKTNSLEWREMVRSLGSRLEPFGSKGRELLDSVSDWDVVSQGGEPQGKSIAVLRSPDVYTVTWLDEAVASHAVVGPHFYVRPLLPELTRPKTFYILALSQKNVRLLRCTSRTSEEVALPTTTATSFDAYMNTAKPDHLTDNRASAGPGTGSSKGVMFTTSTEREAKDEYLAHFYKQIDRGLHECLRGKTEPVVLAGVEYEIALYRSLSKYPHLAEEAVSGAPNSLKAGEMHARAIDAIARCSEHKVDGALNEYNHRVGAGASNRLKEIIPAAHEGRVLTLLISDSLETTGAFDEATYKVTGRETGTSDDEDLTNDAAVQTILHAGQIYVVPNGKMPNGAPLAAIYRF